MRRGIGQEDIMHKQFGTLMRQYEGYKKLNCVFASYMPFGEKRTLQTASLLKAKFTKTGVPDYLFIVQKTAGPYNTFETRPVEEHFIWLEFKKPKTLSAKGKQSDSQKEFEKKFKYSVNSRYYLVYSVEEAVKILEKEQILITK